MSSVLTEIPTFTSFLASVWEAVRAVSFDSILVHVYAIEGGCKVEGAIGALTEEVQFSFAYSESMSIDCTGDYWPTPDGAENSARYCSREHASFEIPVDWEFRQAILKHFQGFISESIKRLTELTTRPPAPEPNPS